MSDLFIRFGVHKDREVLKKMRLQMSGLCIPAHILTYTPDPTKAAIFYAQKPFFIDPMTYRYSENDIKEYVVMDKKDGKNKFKPSMKKLTQYYDIEQLFIDKDYSPLSPSDVTDELISKLTERVCSLQSGMVDDKKESAVERYSDLLKELGESEFVEEKEKDHKPQFYLTPYFYFDSPQDPWFQINLKFAQKTLEIAEDRDKVVPVILTRSETLSPDIINEYKNLGHTKIALWLTDLEERSRQTGEVQKQKLDNYVSFVQKAQSEGVDIIAMHSSYFSIILSKMGVSAVCHGLLHGEYKNKKAQLGGGAPPARYYIRSIHNFLPVTSTQRLFSDPRAIDLLDMDSDPCMKLIKGDHRNIYEVFESNVPVAQMHFLHARNEEIKFVENSDLNQIVNQLKDVYQNKRELVESVTDQGYLDYLDMWAKALEPVVDQT